MHCAGMPAGGAPPPCALRVARWRSRAYTRSQIKWDGLTYACNKQMHAKEVRYRAVVHYTHFLRSLRRVASIYRVSKSSLQRWVSTSTGPTRRKKRTKKQAARDIQDCVVEALQINPFTTSRQLVEHIRAKCGLSVSRSTTNRVVQRSGFTYKKAFRAVFPTPDPAAAAAFCSRYKASGDIICIDEAVERRRGNPPSTFTVPQDILEPNTKHSSYVFSFIHGRAVSLTVAAFRRECCVKGVGEVRWS